MKNLILIMICVSSVSSLYAQSFSVLVRSERSNGTYYQEVELEDLKSDNSFEGKYFKVVKGKSKEAISFDDPNEELVDKAATTYYHLTKARKFWMNDIGSDMPVKVSQIVVRLEITNLFDEQGHYANNNRDPQFNNALSIPDGETPSWVPVDKQDKWGKEIWFRPMKKIDVTELARQLNIAPFSTMLRNLEGPFINYTQNNFQQTVLEHIFYPEYSNNSLGNDALIFAGTIAITKVIIEASKMLDKFFLEKYFYLDTALVPEVIYHEYAHIMLSDSLKMSHSTPVIEGMADYFSAVMSKKRKIYNRVRGHSNSNPKDTESKETYNHWKEANFNAGGDFVLATLWDVKEVMDSKLAYKIIFEARKTLKTDASIYDGLIRSILNSCSIHCAKPRADKLKLYEVFSKRGF